MQGPGDRNQDQLTFQIAMPFQLDLAHAHTSRMTVL
jgi:hypothetical protein